MIEEQLGFGFAKAPARAKPGHEARYIALRFPELRPSVTSEVDSVYGFVLLHRRYGRSCYRVGPKHHLLAGTVVTTQRLVKGFNSEEKSWAKKLAR